MAVVTQARAQAYFNYDPETGFLTHNERSRLEFKSESSYAQHLKRIGTIAGSPCAEGYVRVLVDGKYVGAHKIAWVIMTGEWVVYPENEIDHDNGKRGDNRWDNLKKATKSDNQRNAGQRVNNTSGVHGVNWKPKYSSKEGDGRWVARIWNGPRHVYLGGFKTLDEALIARKAAERVLGFKGVDRPAKTIAEHKAQSRERMGK